MAAPKYKLNLTIGEDSDRILIWRDSNKRPIDITGYKFDCDLYSDSDNIFATLSTNTGEIVLDPLNGKITINFANDLTNVQITPYANYIIWLTTPDGKRKVYLKGQLSFIDP